MKFNHEIGLPVCFDDIDISEDEFEHMMDTADKTTEWNYRPENVSREDYIKAMKEQNAAGRKYKAES